MKKRLFGVLKQKKYFTFISQSFKNDPISQIPGDVLKVDAQLPGDARTATKS